MIINPEKIDNKYATTSRAKANYLIYKCHIPLLGADIKFFYFTNTKELQNSLKKMPLITKIISLIK
jgi:hypothetical protein